MSKMKSTMAAILLTLVFAFPTVGGNIGSPAGSPPPPPPTSDGGEMGSQAQPQPFDLAGNTLSSPMVVDILIALLSLI